MMNEELRMNNGEKQEQQKTIINYKQRAVNKLCHSLTSAVHRSLFYLQFAIYHILFIITVRHLLLYYNSIASIRLINSFPRAVLSSICFNTAVTKVLLFENHRVPAQNPASFHRENHQHRIQSWKTTKNSFLASSYTILSNPTTACCQAFTIPMISCAVIVSGSKP